MKYRKESSSLFSGLKMILFGLLVGIILYGGFYVVVTSDGPSEAIRGLHGGYLQVFIIIFCIIWIGGVSLCVFLMMYSGVVQIISRNNWVIEISDKDIFHQAPHKNVGETFTIKLSDLIKIIKEEEKDDEGGKTYNWYFETSNQRRIDISQNSPFNMKKILSVVRAVKPDIVFVEEKIRW